MPLLFVDLDNTLIDRAGAYRRWAASYLRSRGAPPSLLPAMVTADGDGLRPKPEVAADLTMLLGLTEDEAAGIVTVLRRGVVENLVPDDSVSAALASARSAGWYVVIVTNGVTAQQESKIRLLGLDEEVDGWVVSEAVGVAKPDAEIFDLAEKTVPEETTLDGAWMIGDTPEADIAGAVNAGISSVWLHRGRPYPEGLPEPTTRAASFAEAVAIVLDGS